MRKFNSFFAEITFNFQIYILAKLYEINVGLEIGYHFFWIVDNDLAYN